MRGLRELRGKGAGGWLEGAWVEGPGGAQKLRGLHRLS